MSAGKCGTGVFGLETGGMLPCREASSRIEEGEGKKGSREEMRPGQEIISGNLLKSSLDFDKHSSCSSLHVWPCLTLILG